MSFENLSESFSLSLFLKKIGVSCVNSLVNDFNTPLEQAVKHVASAIEKSFNNAFKEDSLDDKKSDKKSKKREEEKVEKGEKKQRKKQIKTDKICEYIFQRSPKKGVKCTSCVDKKSEQFCSKHINKDMTKVKKIVEKKVKTVEKVRTQKYVKSSELSTCLKALVEKSVAMIRVERNSFGNYQCLDEKIKNFLIDPVSLEMIGIQNEDGKISDLSKSDIELCKELGYLFRLPLNLSEKKESTVVNDEKKEVEEDETCEQSDDDNNMDSAYEESEYEEEN
jgi:hypothetical protein